MLCRLLDCCQIHLHFLKRMEELGVELDTCQLPLNVLDPIFESFQKNALPVSSLVSECNTPGESWRITNGF